MARHTYKQAYETAKRELLQALKKREQLEHQIRKLEHSLKVLGELVGADPQEISKLRAAQGMAIDSRMGFTNAMRGLFSGHKRPLHPTEIRDYLLKAGIGQDQVNLLASIHTVLRRLVENGELKKTEDGRFQAAS